MTESNRDSSDANNQLIHWADQTADRIIRQNGDKDIYTLASGITPSGTVHFGNFREVITVDFVARSLRRRGKKVRFIFSWDDYDTFRKIPKNMPKQDILEKYMFQPIVDTPDPFGMDESYAAHNEKIFEEQIKKVGISAEPLYQSRKYRSGEYKNLIKKTLSHRDDIIAILSQYKTDGVPQDWWPVLIYCEKCNRDRIKSINYDGKDTVTYTCELCGHEGAENLNTTSRVKLPWRVDWPMRWSHEQVDFEPGGKDHSSQGGSYTTAKEIVAKVFGWRPPVYLQYDFVSIKGAGGKMSSSSGEVITVDDVLKVYEPEMVRWIFASYKSNVDFSISFDLDVIKTYEDFDRQERLAYGVEEGNEKKVAMAKRVFELSQLEVVPLQQCPIQPSFRHLCNILQINGGDIEATREYYAQEIRDPRDERRFKERAERALYWINHYAPEDFKFQVNQVAPVLETDEKMKDFIATLKDVLKTQWETFDDQSLHEKLYELINERKIEPQEAFRILYQILINKDKGPKLAGFMRIIGKQRLMELL